jgi:hypothetical protein
MINFGNENFPFVSRFLVGILGRELFSPKITLQRGIGMAVRNVYFVIKMRQ